MNEWPLWNSREAKVQREQERLAKARKSNAMRARYWQKVDKIRSRNWMDNTPKIGDLK